MPNDRTTQGLLDSLGSMWVDAGTAIQIGVYTASRLTQAQLLRLTDYLRTQGLDLTNTAQFDRRVDQVTGADLQPAGPDVIGDNELVLGGVPSVGMGAAAAVGYVLRGIAMVGAAAAAYSFTTNSETVGDSVAAAAAASKIPLLLILLIILALLYAWRKVTD